MGKTLHYFLNYSSSAQSFVYSGHPGVDLLTVRAIKPAQEVSLGPWDVVIVEEN
jgi:beta-galactosidase